MSAYKIQTPGNYPEESTQQLLISLLHSYDTWEKCACNGVAQQPIIKPQKSM